MKSEKLQDAIGMVGDDLIAEAKKKRLPRRKFLIAATAAVLALVICLSIFSGSIYQPPPESTLAPPPSIPEGALTVSPASPDSLGLENLVVAPHYPSVVKYSPLNEEDRSTWADYKAWKNFQTEWEGLYSLEPDSLRNLNKFLLNSTAECLSGSGNQLYSPVNVYMALAMLAECTSGNSRREILKLLGTNSMKELRQQAQDIWIAYYKADGQTNCVFSNSIWLDSNFQYKPEAVQALSDFYFASVFSGDLGAPEMNEQLQTWINAMTGNQLEEYTSNMEFDPLTVFSLVSTINFQAEWRYDRDKFRKEATHDGIFHSSTGDITVKYMQRTGYPNTYYCGKDYTATCQPLTGEHYMWFLLPDEGKTPQTILQNSDWLTMVQQRDQWHDIREAQIIHLKLPKFDINTQMNLVENMKNLGVESIFDYSKANFSPINNSTVPIAVDKIDHAVRVAIDEEGVSAAAYTKVEMLGGGNPEILNLWFERPFLFVITTREGLPLFVGIVDQP